MNEQSSSELQQRLADLGAAKQKNAQVGRQGAGVCGWGGPGWWGLQRFVPVLLWELPQEAWLVSRRGHLPVVAPRRGPTALPHPSTLRLQMTGQLADAQARLEALEAQFGPLSGRSSASQVQLEAQLELQQMAAANESLAAQVRPPTPLPCHYSALPLP
jgi:hypothetical protein